MFAVDLGTVLVALIVSVIAPSVIWWQTRSTKKQDWARQDEVAAKAEAAANAATAAAAQIVAANQASTTAVTHLAELTEGNAEQIATIKTNGEKAVHLADGAYTAAKKTERWALAGKLAADKLLIAYKDNTVNPPTAAERAAIEQGEAMVKALDIEIAAREAALLLVADATPPKGQPVTK